MPLCVSCRGEYWAPTKERRETREGPSEAATPSPLDRLLSAEEDHETKPQVPVAATLPPAAAGLARVYGLSELPPYICARCHQSNQRWHEWATASGVEHFSRFFFHSVPWGWLTLISFLLPILALVASDSISPVASTRIGIPLALVLIFVNFALLYALKDSLWRYNVLSGIGRGFRPSLATMAVVAFLLALVMGLAIAFMAEARAGNPEAGRTEGLVRVTTTILLALTFVNVTLSAIFMAGHDYGNWLNREMPQPIYAQERRLLGVIEEGLKAKIRQATGKKDEAVETTIVDIQRTDDAGVILMIAAETGSDKEGLRQLHNWRITADRWGRVRKMSREGPPQYVEVPVREAAAADESEGPSDNGREKPKEGEVVPAWEESYQTQSETTIAIRSSRRQWME